VLPKKMERALNDQINAEAYSAYLYLSMAAYLESLSLGGFGNWMRIQAQEELSHTMKFFDFVYERGGKVSLTAIDEPPKEWANPLAIFEGAYEHECKVSAMINNLVNIAIDEKDHATNNFLQWFVSEQVEEEASADAVVQKLKLIGDHGNGIFMLDREMGQRVFHAPASQAT